MDCEALVYRRRYLVCHSREDVKALEYIIVARLGTAEHHWPNVVAVPEGRCVC